MARSPVVFAAAAGLNTTVWLAALTMSVLASFVGYIIWNRGPRTLEATQVAVYMYLMPFFGLPLAWLLLDEPISRCMLLGGATFVAGVIVTNASRSQPAYVPSTTPTLEVR